MCIVYLASSRDIVFNYHVLLVCWPTVSLLCPYFCLPMFQLHPSGLAACLCPVLCPMDFPKGYGAQVLWFAWETT